MCARPALQGSFPRPPHRPGRGCARTAQGGGMGTNRPVKPAPPVPGENISRTTRPPLGLALRCVKVVQWDTTPTPEVVPGCHPTAKGALLVRTEMDSDGHRCLSVTRARRDNLGTKPDVKCVRGVRRGHTEQRRDVGPPHSARLALSVNLGIQPDSKCARSVLPAKAPTPTSPPVNKPAVLWEKQTIPLATFAPRDFLPKPTISYPPAKSVLLATGKISRDRGRANSAGRENTNWKARLPHRTPWRVTPVIPDNQPFEKPIWTPLSTGTTTRQSNVGKITQMD